MTEKEETPSRYPGDSEQTSRQEVQESKQKAKIDRIKNQITTSSEYTFATNPSKFDIQSKWASRYLAYRTTPNLRQKALSDKSASQYESRLREVVNFLHDIDQTILKAKFDHIIKYLIYCIELGRRTGTIMNRVSTIKQLYKYIKTEETGVESQISPIQLDSIERSAVDDLTPNSLNSTALSETEVVRLFEEIDHERDRLMTICGVETGFRNSDIRGIRMMDIDFEKPKIKAHDPKFGRAYTVPVSENLALELDLWISGRRKTLLQDKNCEYLFPSRFGGMIKDNSHLGRIINASAKEAGLQNIIGKTEYKTEYMKTDKVKMTWHEVVPHTLRHTFVTLLEKEGVPLEYRRLLANHESAETTQRYSHGKLNILEKAQGRINLNY